MFTLKCFLGTQFNRSQFMKYMYWNKFVRFLSRSNMRTAGIIVIGDEILKGQVRDENSHFIAKELYKMGIKLVQVTVVRDDIDSICEEVKKFSNLFNFVITTGGIGPTHDDVTYEAVSCALGEPLHYHPDLINICCNFYKTTDLNMPGMKLAHVPLSSKLKFIVDKNTQQRLHFPVVYVKNIFMFPGIVKLVKKSFCAVAEELMGVSNEKFYLKSVHLNVPEIIIVNTLNTYVKNYPAITFGSYPLLQHSYYKVKLTLESLDENLLTDVYGKLTTEFERYIINYDCQPLNHSYTKIICEENLRNIPPLKETLKTMESIIESSQDVSKIKIWFDGQIMSTALLHLYYAILTKNHIDMTIKAVYLTKGNLVQELQEFILETTKRYNLQLACLQISDGMDDTMKDHILFYAGQCPKNTEELICKVKRIQPLEKWSFNDIWNFIRCLSLPYCILYDQGYTELLDQNNLKKDPALKKVLSNGDVIFLPAYEKLNIK